MVLYSYTNTISDTYDIHEKQLPGSDTEIGIIDGFGVRKCITWFHLLSLI